MSSSHVLHKINSLTKLTHRILASLVAQCFWIVVALDVVTFEDIYHSKHLESLVASTQQGAQHTAEHSLVLVFYTSKCEQFFDEKELLKLPPQYLVYRGKYNYETFSKFIPHSLHGKENLYERFQESVHDCATGLLFLKGKSLDSPLTWHPGTTSFTSWVWSKFKVITVLKNLLKVPVRVQFIGQGFSMEDVLLKDTRPVAVQVYITFKIIFTNFETSDFIYAYFVTDEQIKVQITLEKSMLKRNDTFTSRSNFLDHYRPLETSTEEYATLRSSKLGDMFRYSFKQASLVTKLSNSSYHLVHMDNAINKRMYKYYISNRKNRQQLKEFLWPVLNDDEKPLTEVSLSRREKNLLLKHVKPLVEKFYSCKMKTVSVVGFLELHQGHVILPHTDNVQKHVVTAIYVVYIENIYPPQWAWRIINNKGAKEDIVVQQGELLILHSARTIHGFKKPFYGTMLVTLHFFFRPESWPWSIDSFPIENGIIEKFLIRGPGFKVIEPMGVIETHITSNTNKQTERRKHTKDEL